MFVYPCVFPTPPRPRNPRNNPALIRSRLEYCSAVVHSASKTQLQKLEVVQKIAARVILDLPKDAHAAPLLETLRLKPLNDRRRDHIMMIMKNILDWNCHPSFVDYFKLNDDGMIVDNSQSRIRLGDKRFKIVASKIYNTYYDSNTSTSGISVPSADA